MTPSPANVCSPRTRMGQPFTSGKSAKAMASKSKHPTFAKTACISGEVSTLPVESMRAHETPRTDFTKVLWPSAAFWPYSVYVCNKKWRPSSLSKCSHSSSGSEFNHCDSCASRSFSNRRFAWDNFCSMRSKYAWALAGNPSSFWRDTTSACAERISVLATIWNLPARVARASSVDVFLIIVLGSGSSSQVEIHRCEHKPTPIAPDQKLRACSAWHSLAKSP
mmetsp:Transcript_101270/g.285487  ORF Transcript_101270/g.285487 Transcript_101270/m.285487 type:complete len:222 (-) Transcript_101270:11-676(-)